MEMGIFEGVRARLLCGTGLIAAGIALIAPAPALADEVVTVTGSRLSSTFEAPTPVTVVDATQIKQSGFVNIEDTLNDTPQFRGSQADGKFNNGAPSGNASVNLRGLGAQRNLVLVNGRRFTIQGADQTTDINTIPTALIERTEIVTGGSSAVYGSDAITGVVNFIMRQDFQGVEAQSHVDFDSITTTPTYSIDFTAGANFAQDKGNIAVSMGYLNRGGISRQDRGGIYVPPSGDGCVTPSTFSTRFPGKQVTGVAAGAACVAAGDVNGLVFAGSGDIPNGRYIPLVLPGGTNTALNTAYANAGLTGLGSFGYTYDNAGATARAAIDPDDRYNLTLPNYLQVPMERWMLNTFAHYDLLPRVTAYAEMHYSTNTVTSQLSPSNINSTMLFNTNNAFLSPAMKALFTQLDANEPAAGVTATEGSKTYKTTANDGIAALTVGRRFTDVGFRVDNEQRVAWRFVGGFRGTLPNVSDDFLTDLSWDIYYDYSKTTNTDRQNGSVSRSRLQDALLGTNPVCDIFGQNISAACVNAIAISSINVTEARMSDAVASVSGTLFNAPAGPVAFALGGETRATAAQFVPDTFLSSGDVAGFNAALPTKGHESVNEVFGEVRVPIVKDVPFFQSLSLNGAFRNSSYDLSGVGSVWTYSAGVDWKANDSISFRGQYQRAIRAPNVGELFGGQAQGFTAATDPCGLGGIAKRSSAVDAICLAQGVPQNLLYSGQVQPSNLIGNVTGGNPNLSAEASETLTLGTVVTPEFVPGLAVSVDWFSIGINGAIGQLGGGLVNALNLCYYTLQSTSSIYCKAVNRDPNNGSITAPLYVQVTNANTGAAKTQGVDINAQYGFDLGFGLLSDDSNLRIATAWTWTTEFTLTPVKELSTIKNECVGSFGTTCGSPIPSLKGTTRFTWTDGPLSLSLRHRYIGSVEVDTFVLPFRASGANPPLANFTNPIIDDQHYIDLTASYDITEDVRIDGGVNNAFNFGPPVQGSAANGNITFPATYDPLGQEFFFDLTFKTN